MPDDRIGEVGSTIAALRAELAQAKAERDEALAQQAATAEVLQVVNSSPGDLQPVFGAILEKAHRLCGADQGAMFLYDGDLFRNVATRGIPEAFADELRKGVRDGPISSPLIAGAPLAHVPDLAEINPTGTAVKVAGTRTMLSVPLRKADTLLGMIVSARRAVRPFSDSEIALLQNFAAQAVIAMENARLLTETREALDRQTATAEVLQVINSSPGDLAPVFGVILEKTLRLCDGAFGNLLTYDGDLFDVEAAVHRNGRIADEVRQRPPFRAIPGGTLAPMQEGQDVSFTENILETPDYKAGHAGFRRMVDAGGYRSVLNVALRKEGTLLGTIGIFDTETRTFTDKQIALLENFAAQAVIAMENARLLTETREALDQQTATAEVLQVINASPGELAPVFDAMLEKAMRLCEAAFGALFQYDGSLMNLLATRGESAEAAGARQTFKPDPGSALEQLALGAPMLHIADVVDTDAYRSGVASRVRLVELTGARTALWVALRKDDALVGTFVIYRREVRPFSDKQIALLQNFAAQAVIAMENVRLLTETREALDQQTATAEVLQVINSSPGDLKPVFEAMLEKAVRLCQASFGILWNFDGELAIAGALHRVPEAYAKLCRTPFRPSADSGPARMIRGEGTLSIADIRDSPAYRDGDALTRAIVDLAGARSIVIAPLRKDTGSLGAITLYRQEVRPFTDAEVALLQNFAAQAVIAMENARLLGELRQRTDEVAELNRGLEARVAAQLAELQRVGSLKRFLPPQVAEMVVSQGDEKILESHRREIVVVFADVRNYTTFTETAEPEEVIEFLGEYHAVLGPLITRFEGTLSHFFGDGLMVFFNDPVPCPDPAQRAVNMAVAMRETAGGLMTAWRRRGHRIGFGVGIAQGYATLGQIGFAERMDYTAIGTVTNLAARLCDAARDSQILISSRIATAVEGAVTLEEMGDQSLKGLSQAVAVYNVMQ